MKNLFSNIKIVIILFSIFVISCKKEHQLKLRIQNNFGVDITEIEAGGVYYGDLQYGATSVYKIILSGEDKVLRFSVPNVKDYKSIFYVNSRGKLKMQINPIGEDIIFIKD